MAEEKIYFQDKDVFVSSTQVKIGSFTYQVKNISSYRAVRGGGTIFTMAPFLIGLAVLAMFVPTQNPLGIGSGVALIILGIAQFVMCKTLYLNTSGEQLRGYTTYSLERMRNLMSALDQAMADNNR